MIMADVLKIFLIIVGLLIAFVCYWLLFEALAPEHVKRSQVAYRERPWKVLLSGLGAGIPLTLLGLAMANAGAAPVKLVGVVVLFAVVLVALLGSAGLARHIGLRLPTARDASEPWRPVLRGGIVLSVCFVLPGIGWFVLLPYALITGVGAAVMARRVPEVATILPAPADTLGSR